jgi:hypothetical protein
MPASWPSKSWESNHPACYPPLTSPAVTFYGSMMVTSGFLNLCRLTDTKPAFSKVLSPRYFAWRSTPQSLRTEPDSITVRWSLIPPKNQRAIPIWNAFPGSLAAGASHAMSIGPLRNFSPGLCLGSFWVRSPALDCPGRDSLFMSMGSIILLRVLIRYKIVRVCVGAQVMLRQRTGRVCAGAQVMRNVLPPSVQESSRP